MGQRIILATFGSLGDIHPFMALALGLQARGHQVTIATSEYYRAKIIAAGIGFHAIRPDLPPDDQEVISLLMDARKGTERIIRQIMMPHLRDSYDDLMTAVQGADLLVTHEVIYAGPLVAQKTGIRWVSCVLSPIAFFSAYDPPVLPPYPALSKLRALGPVINGAILRLGKLTTRNWLKPVRQLRLELGLPLAENPLFEGKHSPKLVLALFSPLLAQPQPDWPPQTVATGFALYDRVQHNEGLAPQLQQFLAAGPPPIVFTLGSAAVMDPGNFYIESVAAAHQLGCRAVLLVGKEPRQLPELPQGVAAFDYAPYTQLFPRAAAVVHQGGIGTTAQVLHAGRPMLVMPYSHDQPDNAARIVRLGVGRVISRNHYRCDRVAAELRQLLQPEYATSAAEVAQRIAGEDGVQSACEAIEKRLDSPSD
ncbi:probable glucosyltransferase [uncultured Synechococcales cyanobacterium]|uniref:Probable glucosyltransferase n=1 Tax=uncultured Synechococcales cyanobacterium TaxID=1936017 RepID=A0A6J4V291_9CYAN|nr:probable glucosyltransferase [uncultured Synechococcales cyanobacterium]